MAQLRHFESELIRRRTSVLLICFGPPYWAGVFLEETQSPFPLLIDTERETYRSYGLKRSIWRTWSPQVIWYYLKSIVQGKKVRVVPASDPHQLGGDFLVGSDGRILLAHPSKEPTDRPSVETILAAIDAQKPPQESPTPEGP